MRIKFIQKAIDKLRNKKLPIEKIMKGVENQLLDNGYVFSDKENVVITPEGVKFTYNPYTKDALIYAIYEIFLKREYGIILDADIIFIDIGMNLAITSLYFASMKNIKKIYAFEPFVPTYNSALMNINLNLELAKKIQTFNIGLGNENKEIEVPYNIGQAGCMSCVYNPFELNEKVCKKIETIEKLKICDAAEILEPIINKNCNQELIVLKIDTEGSEFDIFQSLEAQNLFAKIDVIMLEYHYKSPKILEEVLLKNNFTIIYNPQWDKKIEVGMIFAFKNRKVEKWVH